MSASTKTVKQIFKITKGRKVNSVLQQKSPESVRYLQIGDLRRDLNIQYTEDVHLVDVYDDDMIIAWDGSNAGLVGFGLSGVIGSTLARLRIKDKFSDQYEPAFLGYFLQSKFRYLQDTATGVAVPHVNKTALEQIEIPKEDLITQRQIVTALNKANYLIDNRQRVIQALYELLDSVYTTSFRGIASVHGDSRSSPLGSYIDIHHGYAFKSQFFTNEGGYKLLTPGNFNESGGFRDLEEKQKFYAGEFPERFLLQRGDLLIVMTEQTKGLLGSPLFVPGSNYLHNQRLGLVEITSAEVNPQFLFHLFNSELVKEIIHFQSTGAKVRHTSPTKIKSIQVWLPSREQQDQFVVFANKIKSQIQLQERSLKDVNHLFQSLLQRAFHGDLIIDPDLQLDGYLENENFAAIAGDGVLIQTLIDRFNQAKSDAFPEEVDTSAEDEEEENQRFRFESEAAYNVAKDALFHLLKEGLVTQEAAGTKEEPFKTYLTIS